MIDIAYLAGLTDGEGHISVFRRKPVPPYVNTRYSLRTEICMCSLETIKWIQKHFGGTIYKKKRTRTLDTGKLRKQSYTVSWSGYQAAIFFKKLDRSLLQIS